MKSFIMAAGFGTRLEPLTLAVPKPMVPLLNKPIMQHNIDLLKKYGLRDICANIHYFPEQIENFFNDGSEFGVRLCYSYEEKLLGTAGGVKKMAEVSGGVKGAFLVLSSDALTDIDLSKLISFHKKRKAVATIALSPVLDTSQFGVVVPDEIGRVLTFQEKPLPGKALSNLANTGIYVFEPEILEMIPKGRFYDFGKDLFPKLVKQKAHIYGYQASGYWSDVGGIEQYVASNADALLGRVKISFGGRRTSRGIWVGRGSKISKSAKLTGPVILGDGVEVGAGSRIVGPAVLGDKCVIGEGAGILASIIWSDTVVGKGARLEGCVVGNWCAIEDGVRIEPDCVIGNRSRIRKREHIPAGTKIKPESQI